MLITRPPPTVADLTDIALRETRFVTETTAENLNNLRICAELAAGIAAEKWEAAHQAPIGETLPPDLIAEVAAALQTYGETKRATAAAALYAAHVKLERSIATLATARSSIDGVLPLAAAESLMDNVETHFDHIRVALTRARELFDAAIDRAEWAASRRRQEAV
jgi:hypothetical protein